MNPPGKLAKFFIFMLAVFTHNRNDRGVASYFFLKATVRTFHLVQYNSLKADILAKKALVC